MLEEEIQASYDRLQPSMGFGYNICSVAHEHIYHAVIIDLFSRKCIGWDLSRNMGEQLTLNALAKAFRYASRGYVDCLKEHCIQISMSRKGNPYDNEFAESFIKRAIRAGGGFKYGCLTTCLQSGVQSIILESYAPYT
jgi:transposase InsO family protein